MYSNVCDFGKRVLTYGFFGNLGILFVYDLDDLLRGRIEMWHFFWIYQGLHYKVRAAWALYFCESFTFNPIQAFFDVCIVLFIKDFVIVVARRE